MDNRVDNLVDKYITNKYLTPLACFLQTNCAPSSVPSPVPSPIEHILLQFDHYLT